MTISFESKVTVPEQVLVSELACESVLLNLQSAQYHGLNDVGTRFWRRLTSSDSIQDAYEELLREFDVAPETLRTDLVELVEMLRERGLVNVVGA